MLTATGAKLLDFGLAKLRTVDKPVVGSQSFIPTEVSQLTMQGTIVGTLQYMSPEQLEGRDADPRTDLFALGGVMYEMLTGRKAFEGKSQASLIAAIIHVDPPSVTLLSPITPPALERIIRKCLAKNPDDRWQTAKDLVDELRWISGGNDPGSIVSSAASVPAAPPRRSRLSLALAGFFFLTTVALIAAILLHKEPRTFGMIRMKLDPPDKNVFPGGAPSPEFEISEDGRLVAFTAVENGKQLLWVQPFDSPTGQALTETAGASSPFWSPDGRHIGFFADTKLKKVEVTGGVPLTLCDLKAKEGEGGTWNSEGTILFAPTVTSGLMRVSANGGEPVPVTKVDAKSEVGHVWPQFLPDGRHFIYLSIGKAQEATAIYVGSLDGDAPKRLVQTQVRAAYASGYLLFVRENVLMAQRFDPKSFTLSREPVRVADQVATNFGNGRAAFKVSESGVLAFRTGVQSGYQQLVWFDRQSKQTVITPTPALFRTHDLAPDGKRIIVHRHDNSGGGGDLWIIEPDRNLTTRFTFGDSHYYGPIWSPDATKIVYSSAKTSHAADLYQKLSSGAASEELLLNTPNDKHAVDWSRDGKYILYESINAETKTDDLWVLPTFGDKKPIPFLTSPFHERRGRFSPDGKWIAYTSNESGQDQIYIQPFPPNGGKWQVSTSGGFEPRWRADGKELYYINSRTEAKLMAVTVKWSSTPEFMPPQEVLVLGNAGYGVDDANQYVVSADGQKFLLVRDIAGPTGGGSIEILFNWLAGLKK
jgi:Tol biopolymer transport system component